MIVLKNLARDYDIDPYALRMKLRKKFGIRRRWRWPDESDPHLIQVREYLKKSVAPSKKTS